MMALAADGSGKPHQAQEYLVKSLILAEPEGYMRIFLDEGQPMQELLLGCRTSAEACLKVYIDRMLNAFSSPGQQPVETSAQACTLQPLVEPLTVREMEVLHLLAVGLSNREIAGRLYLSEGTVKTHTHNLYGKLGVQSRTQAIARGKDLRLI